MVTSVLTLPQLGIFAQGSRAHHFLELDLRPGIEPAAAVAPSLNALDAVGRRSTPEGR